MRAVANSSVLIALSRIQRLELLPIRFSEGIFIPDAVWNEVVEAGYGRPGARAVSSSKWIRRASVRNRELLKLLEEDLDEGEAEAIALAKELNITIVLLDEKEARRKALRFGLRPLGTVGILIWAKRVNLIQELKPELERLRYEAGFRLSEKVYKKALEIVGE